MADSIQVAFSVNGRPLQLRVRSDQRLLDVLRDGPARNGIVPVLPRLHARIKYFGRYKRGGIRDGFILLVRAV